MQMHIFLRRATESIRFSKGFKPSHPNSLHQEQEMGSHPIPQAAPSNIFPGYSSSLLEGTTGTFILDLTVVLLTGYQRALVSIIPD